ncbi:PhoX family protein [Pseudonocardia sp.]|uniref:PhoX family protein n=1 Tax=Pseudonocardia sp. TaxID=60912 RepID=UPI003D0BDF68
MTDRRVLPLLPAHHRGRQGLTCRYRCGDACARPAPNPSANPYFGDLLARAVDRRAVLRAGAVLTVAAGAAPVLAACTGGPGSSGGNGGDVPAGLRYEPVVPNTADAVTVPSGYAQNVVIGWGDAVLPGAPAFDFDAQTSSAQAAQFGYNNDYVGLVPLPGDGERYLMFVNHEYTIEPLMFRDYDEAAPTDEQIRVGQAAHGLSLVVVQRDATSGQLTAVTDERNRRWTASSEFELVGPAAGAPPLQTAADPTGRLVAGTLNNCSGGTTPWGTFLSGEENVNQYFANAQAVTDPVAAARLARYGFEEGASERKWERLDARFDIAQHPNEVHRFGWVVEVDPLDPDARPVKHTALGRLKHEGATIHLAADGRPVAYMGDDERFDYVYKFVSDRTVTPGENRAAREANRQLLQFGTLYVARFDGPGAAPIQRDGSSSGTGEWIRLASGTTSYVDGMTAEEVYVFTREAADKAGATKMDRPEDVEANPRTGTVYLALTNNSDRGKAGKAGPDAANPRADNKHGHVIELVEDGGDAAATTFAWSILLICGDPADPATYFAGFDRSQVSPITSPDNLAFDTHGNLWISTDSTAALDINDGLYGVALEGPARGRTTLFASTPVGAECCGPVITDEFTLIAVQHPGDTEDASPDAPGSTWPDGPGRQPRPAIVNIWHDEDGRPARIGV